MFEEEAWNDDPQSLSLVKTFSQVKGDFSNTSSVVRNIPEGKNRKKLLKTLQILKAASRGSQIFSVSEEQPKRSDSEDSEPDPVVTKKKRKKKRSRKSRSKSGTDHPPSREDLWEDGVKVEDNLNQSKLNTRNGTKEKTVRRAGSKKNDGCSATDSKVIQKNDRCLKEREEGSSQPPAKISRHCLKTEVSEKHLSRKQWRNRMKNKKRNKNKFKIGDPEEFSSGLPPSQNARTPTFEYTSSQDDKLTGSKVLHMNSKVFKKQQKDVLSRLENEEQENLNLKTTKDSKTKTSKGVKFTGGPGDLSRPRIEAKVLDKGDPVELSKDQVPLKTELQAKANGSGLEKRNIKLLKLKRILQQQEKVRDGNQEVVAEGSVPLQKPDSSASDIVDHIRISSLPDRSASLRMKMEERLKSARFRYINQQLYTSSSHEAKLLFQHDKAAFEIYHRGYTMQVQRWPENPLDRIIQYIKNKPASLIVADFGCGDCRLARSVKNQVHSFDLVALNDCVSVCDMAHVPLPDESVDVAVFCLSLMGTNLRDFLEEANRVLKVGSVLKIAEVASRFEDVRKFITALSVLGFKLTSKDTESKFFYMFDFIKTGSPKPKSKISGLELKACLYKKR
ncbi:ribosomal RNA-processing protein 8 [Protopterus annectens]|uniref:ribosomal RNA-processing protein 8 n=1 Tax=Protopterus annectens TaxID=7888 RepID=UPI001CFA9AB9|nr:ribosomal RNA-processing protein 8 [Protopterus annectens]XP_043928864.1 ribosomal RNA-processing protein 8 [Protopterus annectens]XP_043928865.1 ribosomal RNA-processing protein 8 [Protopterus annectens]XP_043928866.1 ribosomal RNA-processing protein 8 [Protopterus annectens]